jgi:dipeptidyl aminopeptidase/acylaminoacyl peptidase
MDAEPSCSGRRVDSRLARGWSFVAVLAVACATAGPAWASFPGANGTIVYQWTSANKYVPSPTSIRAVEPRGGPVRVLRDCPLQTDRGFGPYVDCQVFTPRYSPDGSRIAFSSVQVDYQPGQGQQYRSGVGLMASDGTTLDDHATADSHLRLAWSPAGDRILLEHQAPGAAPGASAIFLASLDGTELRQVTPQWTGEPDWSSTGRIAFVRSDPDCPFGCANIFITRLGGSPRRLTHRGGRSPSWSPHGTKLAFVRLSRRDRGDRGDVYVVRRDGSGLRRLTRRGGYSPAWSPDGRRIAFIRNGDVYVVRTTGGHLRRLVDELGPDETYGLGPQVTSVDWQALPRP